MLKSVSKTKEPLPSSDYKALDPVSTSLWVEQASARTCNKKRAQCAMLTAADMAQQEPIHSGLQWLCCILSYATALARHLSRRRPTSGQAHCGCKRGAIHNQVMHHAAMMAHHNHDELL